MLHVNKQRAIAGLSMGQDTSSVARTIGVCRQTVCRWKRDPEFQKALQREVGEMMGNLHIQVQTTARSLVEGGMEGAQTLRYMLVEPGVEHQDRRLSAQVLLKHASRFWAMLGYSADAKEPAKLLNEILDEDESIQNATPLSDHPEGAAGEPEPLDRHLKSDMEQDPPQRHVQASICPPWATDWRFNQVYDDGTPKGPPDYFHHNPVLAAAVDEAQRAIEELHRDCETNPDPNPEPESELDLEAAKQETEAEHIAANPPESDANADDIQIIPASHKSSQPKPKPWKRSATTLRCKPGKKGADKCNILSHSDASIHKTARTRLAPNHTPGAIGLAVETDALETMRL